MKKEERKVLEGYKRKGKKFHHPFIAEFGDTIRLTDWHSDFLPDILMICLLLDQMESKQAVDIMLRTAKEIKSIINEKDLRSFGLISDYYDIDADSAKTIRERLAKIGTIDIIKSNIAPLISLYSECPLRILFEEDDLSNQMPSLEFSLGVLDRVLRDCFDRTSREAAIAQTTLLYICGGTETITISQGIEIGDLNSIVDYPETDESRKVASSSRALVKMLMADDIKRSRWRKYFWRHGYKISPCVILNEDDSGQFDTDNNPLDEYYELANKYKFDLIDEIDIYWNLLELDLAYPEKDEVLGGLIARQVRFASSIATETNLCSFDIGRILMRCMIDTHITIVWLIEKNDKALYKKFVDYGKGQDKLLREHLSNKSNGITAGSFSVNDRFQSEANFDNYLDFTTVDVGHWAGKSTRQMAEEADCMDIYNLSFSPLSASIHGTWNEISKMNLQYCYNPLHGLHRIPKLEKPPIYLGIPDHAALVMNESLMAWITSYGIIPNEELSSVIFRRKLNDIFIQLGKDDKKSKKE